MGCNTPNQIVFFKLNNVFRIAFLRNGGFSPICCNRTRYITLIKTVKFSLFITCYETDFKTDNIHLSNNKI